MGSQGDSTATNGLTTPPNRVRICVYCGASPGASTAHMEAARELARLFAENDIELVYGGGTVGLMGEIAKTLCLLKGPEFVHGIIPAALVKYERDGTYQDGEQGRPAVPEEAVYGRTTIVKDMHTRKKLMAEKVFAGAPGSGFIGLSGGFGTMEEIFETTTWNQLGIHTLGICLLNVDGFWDGILKWLDDAVDQGFVKEGNKNILVTASSPKEAIEALRNYRVSEATYKLDWDQQ